MYKDEDGEAAYDERELYEHQLSRAIEWITAKYPKCRIINLSLGDSSQAFHEGIRQSNLATLIDELSKEYNLVFIISAGNIDNGTFIELREDYPEYLLNQDNKIGIINPATSALGLTVGAVYRSANDSEGTIFEYFPSRDTRVGPGIRRMIKPELVEEGGNGFGTETDIITINPRWYSEGRLFTRDCGTSFSAPKVAHYAAQLLNKYPGSSGNLIKALLLSSAAIPAEKPEPLSEIDITLNDECFISVASIYGYGKPDLDRAIYSSNNKVVLVRENNIHLNRFHIYSFFLPPEFWETKGLKQISVTLVFDPLVRKNRYNYLGVSMEAHLFKNIEDIDLIRKKYGDIEIGSMDDEIVPEDLRSYRIHLFPGILTRKRGAHQKGIAIYPGRPKISADVPLYLVVICQNRWIKDAKNQDDPDYIQDYAIVVSVEHAEGINIYNDIRIKNRERIGLSVKA